MFEFSKNVLCNATPSGWTILSDFFSEMSKYLPDENLDPKTFHTVLDGANAKYHLAKVSGARGSILNSGSFGKWRVSGRAGRDPVPGGAVHAEERDQAGPARRGPGHQDLREVQLQQLKALWRLFPAAPPSFPNSAFKRYCPLQVVCSAKKWGHSPTYSLPKNLNGKAMKQDFSTPRSSDRTSTKREFSIIFFRLPPLLPRVPFNLYTAAVTKREYTTLV